MVRLQRVLSRRVGEAVYYKWQVTLPEKEMEKAGWKPGANLAVEFVDGRITIRRKR